MKKTTYALIILTALVFVATFAFIWINRTPSTKDYSLTISVIDGPMTEISLEDFNSIQLSDPDAHIFLDSDDDEISYSAFTIEFSDTVSAPKMIMSEGWKEHLAYDISDSKLNISLTDKSFYLKPQVPPVRILIPSRSSLSLYSDISYEFNSDDVIIDSLYVETDRTCNLGNLRAEKVTIYCIDTYNYIYVHAEDACINDLVFLNAKDLVLYPGEDVKDVTFHGNDQDITVDISIEGNYSEEIHTVAHSNKQQFNFHTTGSHTFKISE